MEVDMSDKAVTGRLKRVEQLRRLCLSLAKSTKVSTQATNAAAETSRKQGNANGQNAPRN